ncbi:MAG: HPr family phosphocarrier protein [Clostridia bacterium]|nr:HPr family phosphocarrier protein [Clostridia bacterium]
MIKEAINIKPILPMKRDTAASIATLASRFDCTFTIEAHNMILNAKSMLGLLSMSLPEDGQVSLSADGDDEAAAITAMSDLIRRLIAQL